MYKIVSITAGLLGYTEEPNYVRQVNDVIVHTIPVLATGVNFKDCIHNIVPHQEFENCDSVYITKVTESELNQFKVSMEQQTTDLQLAIIDLYESTISQT